MGKMKGTEKMGGNGKGKGNWEKARTGEGQGKSSEPVRYFCVPK